MFVCVCVYLSHCVCVCAQALARKHEEAVHQLRSEGAALLRQEELEAGLVQRGLSDEGEGERRQMREDQLRLAAAQENDRALSAEQKLQLLKETHDIRRELQHQVVRGERGSAEELGNGGSCSCCEEVGERGRK